jgi:hypothetical protein
VQLTRKFDKNFPSCINWKVEKKKSERGERGIMNSYDTTILGRGSLIKINSIDSWNKNIINTHKYNTNIHLNLSISYYNLVLYFNFKKG